MIKIILASSSPRRKQLLQEVGLSIDIQVANIDEVQHLAESPEALVRRLSREKAAKIADINRSALVIGADTDVDVDGVVLGKPADFTDACRLFGLIQGREHKVWGGFTIICRDLDIEVTESSVTYVTMAAVSQEMIERYVRTGEPMDKAGAYAMQGIGGQFVEKINGSHTNVVGLDLPKIVRSLRSLNIELPWEL